MNAVTTNGEIIMPEEADNNLETARDAAAEGLEKAKEAVGSLGADVIQWVIIAAVVLVILYIAYRVLKGRKKPVAAKGAPGLKIDVMALGNAGPPAEGPTLELLNVPVRLAAVVLAPAGRVRDLPPPSELHDLYEAIVPGLTRVVGSHQPLVRRWPGQVSAQGFAHMFFQHVRLPGEAGRGTPWSSIGGLAKVEGQPFMVGLVLRTATPSSHAQYVIDSEEKWLGMLRVKGA
jgi:hypothetical protein